MRVLIAEDSGVLRRALARAIQSLGHTCLEAVDGMAAWELFQRESADVVLSDWIMPGLEGPELCRLVRGAAGRPYTYFILLTVLEEKRHALSGMRAGADDYLTKPVDLDDLQLRLIAAERVTDLHRRLATREAEGREASFVAGLNAAQERVRAQVAELLHGRVQTRLLIAHHRLSRVEQLWDDDPARARHMLAEARDMLDRVREEDVRRASHLLHPGLLREGIGPALRALAHELGPGLPLDLDLDPILAEGPGALPPGLALAVYRVVEEAIANAARHAAAGRAVVRIHRDDAQLCLAVEDDGKGFDRLTTATGLGLSSIAGRVAEHGGTWEIVSAPGQGTIVRVGFPLPG